MCSSTMAGIHFLLDSQMKWEAEPNAFLAWLSVVNGRTSSVRTWRSYAYHFADWLSFCERIGVPWRHVTELNIATYRNILAKEASPHTGRVLRRSTINYKLGVICQFYRFAHRKGWLNALPFEREASRIPYNAARRPRWAGRAGFCSGGGKQLKRCGRRGKNYIFRPGTRCGDSSRASGTGETNCWRRSCG